MGLDKIDTFLTQLHSNPSPEKRAVVILQLFDFSTKHVLPGANLTQTANTRHRGTHRFWPANHQALYGKTPRGSQGT